MQPRSPLCIPNVVATLAEAVGAVDTKDVADAVDSVDSVDSVEPVEAVEPVEPEIATRVCAPIVKLHPDYRCIQEPESRSGGRNQ